MVKTSKTKKPKKEKINVEKIISELVGEDVLDVVRKIKNKDNISENEIVNNVGKDLNQARNALYKLYENNLVSFTRKKDKNNGLYIYYWTFNEDKVQNIIDSSNREKLEMLKNRLEREKSNQFFKCKNNCIRLDFDQALDFEFRCPECGELLEFDDNYKKIKEIEDKIIKIQKYFEKRQKDKKEQAKIVMQNLKIQEKEEQERLAKEKLKEEALKKKALKAEKAKSLKNRIKINKDIFLIEKFDKKLFDLLIEYYKPLLSKKHKNDKYQYLIYKKKKVIGIISYKQKSSNILQLILLPTKQKKKNAVTITKKLSTILKVKTFYLNLHKFNFPGFKFLNKLKGGITTKNSKNINQKGIMKLGKTKVAKKYNTVLDYLIKSSEKDFKTWKKEFTKRKELKAKIKDHLKTLKV